MKGEFLNDENSFLDMRRRMGSVVDIQRRLPEQVFNDPAKNFTVTEVDWVMSGYFWSALKDFYGNSSDESITIAVLEPDPVNYYLREFGYYNAFKLPLSASLEEYWSLLKTGPEESPADAILFNSNVVVWFPDSLSWVIWGQRDTEICILARNINNVSEEKLFADWVSIDDAISSFLCCMFRDLTVPVELAAELRLNYSG